MSPGKQLLWFLVVGLAAGAGWAGGGEWTSGGPEGGPVEALVFDPGASSTLYAATRHNAVFRSADGAASWAAAGVGLPRAVASLAITADGTLFAIGDGGGVLRSTDDGASWQEVLGGTITAIAADPSANGTVYAGTPLGVVHKTTNAGAGWSSSASGLPENPIAILAVDPQTPANVYLGVDAGGAYKSTDGGASWVARSQGIGGTSILSLVFDPQTPATLYIATDEGLFKSTDGAGAWSELAGPGGAFIDRLAVDPAAPSTLLGGAFGTVFRSLDGGASWSEIGAGVPPAEMLALAVDPASSSIFYAGTGAGVVKSVDGGANWTAMNQGLRSVRVVRLAVDPGTPTTLYAASSESGLFKSTDAGGSWAPAGSGLGSLALADVALAPSLPQTLYLAQLNGLRSSQDGAASWADPVSDPDEFGLLGPEVRSLAVDPLDAGTLFAANRGAGTRDGPGGPGILRSVDGGVSWLRLFEPTDLTAIQAGQLAIDPGDPDRVLGAFAGRVEGGVAEVSVILRSLDGGGSWNEELRRAGAGVVALDYDPLVTSTVYALVAPGPGFAALRSHNGGNSWSDLPLPLACVNDLLPDPVVAGTLWAACDPLDTSEDGGASWAAFDDNGFPAGVGGALAVARASGAVETIHLGTPVGVYSYDLLPRVDLYASKDDGVTETTPGSAVTYTIEVGNLGPTDALGATVTDDLPAELTCTWSCAGSGGGVCDPAPPAGDLDETVDLPVGATVTFTASCTIDGGAGGLLVNQVVATAPIDVVDTVAANDTASDTDVVLELGPCGTFNDRHLSGVVLAGSETIEACSSIRLGPDVEVASDVLLRAPTVGLLEVSLTGGTLTVLNEVPVP